MARTSGLSTGEAGWRALAAKLLRTQDGLSLWTIGTLGGARRVLIGREWMRAAPIAAKRSPVGRQLFQTQPEQFMGDCRHFLDQGQFEGRESATALQSRSTSK
jgi:hypothetical protein